jgi:hypothetical protein
MVIESKKKKKKKKKTKHLRKRINDTIIDVPLSKTQSKGSRASLGKINYHYQEFGNTFTYFEILLKRSKRFRKLVCIPNISSSWMKAFLVHEFIKKRESSYTFLSVRPVDSTVKTLTFVRKIKECLKTHQIVPVSFTLEIPSFGKHANMIVFDSKHKTIEHFEPHGFHEDSQWSISRAYTKAIIGVKKFALNYFSDYSVISPKDYEPKNGLQATIDAYSGMCVTWSILYLNYRILNPEVPSKKLVRHINKKIKRNTLLKFTRYVELVLKKYGKI